MNGFASWPHTLEDLLSIDREYPLVTSIKWGCRSNREVYAMVQKVARSLEGAGLKRGGILYYQGEDSLQSLVGLLASAVLDNLFLPLNPKLDRPTSISIAERFPKTLDLADFDFSQLGHADDNERLFAESEQVKTEIFLNHRRVAILSSGSTAMPKVIFHSLESLFEAAYSSNLFYEIGPEDRLLLSLGLFHIGGLQIAVRALLARAQILIGRGPRYSLRDASRLRPSILSLVPTQLFDLLSQPELLQDLSRAPRVVLVGGAACPQPLYEQALASGLPISLCYGSTESGAQIIATEVDKPPQSSACAGQILPFRQIRVCDGVLQFRGWGCARAIDRGDGIGVQDYEPCDWIDTNDRAEWSDRSIRILGRLDEVIISGGENVDLAQIRRHIENALPDLKVAFLRVSDERLGECYEMLLESAVMPSIKLLHKAITDLLSSIQQPTKVFWRPLQRSSGKLSQAQLLQLLSEQSFKSKVQLLWQRN